MGRQSLEFGEKVKVRTWLEANVDFINKQGWSRERIAGECSKALGLEVTAGHLPAIVETIDAEFTFSGRRSSEHNTRVIAELVEQIRGIREQLASADYSRIESALTDVQTKIAVLDVEYRALAKASVDAATRLQRLEADLNRMLDVVGVARLSAALPKK